MYFYGFQSENAGKNTSACVFLSGDVALKREAIFSVVCLAAVGICHMRGFFHMLSNVWYVVLKDKLHSEHNANLFPFSLRLTESRLKRETCHFSSSRMAV